METRATKKLIIYQDRMTGNYFIRATAVNEKGNFVLKTHHFGVAKSKNINDDELGKSVRNILNNCD